MALEQSRAVSWGCVGVGPALMVWAGEPSVHRHLPGFNRTLQDLDRDKFQEEGQIVLISDLYKQQQ